MQAHTDPFDDEEEEEDGQQLNDPQPLPHVDNAESGY